MDNYTDCSQAYTEQRFMNVAVTATATACLSFIACLFKKWQTFGQRLIAYLIISATLLSVASIMRRVDYDKEFTPGDARFCTFSAFMIQIT